MHEGISFEKHSKLLSIGFRKNYLQGNFSFLKGRFSYIKGSNA